jgi:N-acylneuraminate cytidylyltransferase/CMP-N,N'-diacetyllegionaminic acid synthase
MNILAIIPARGGSKGIPRKNLYPLAGKPLIAWTIETALKCKLLNRVIVSTEDPEIASISQKYGAEVPFLRPLELAGDETPGIAPLIHAITWLKDNDDYIPDLVLLLQPTSPLREVQDITKAITIFNYSRGESVVSVTLSQSHPHWMKQITDEGHLINFVGDIKSPSRRQDLSPVYSLNGAIYLIKHDLLLSSHSFFTGRTYGYVMPPERSLDIDTEWDMYIADLILKDRVKNDTNW